MRLKRGTLSVGTPALLLWGTALACHAAGLWSILTDEGLNLAFFKSGAAVALLVTAILLVGCLRRSLLAMTPVMLPLAAAFVLAGEIDDHRVIVSAETRGIQAHILSSLLAYSILGFTGVQAIVLHFQNRDLRHYRSDALLRRLPPLDAMESLLFHLLMLGFVLLTVSLTTGWLYHENLLAQHLMHKTVLSGAAWLMFATLLTGHLFYGWRGERAVKFTLTGLGLLIVGYFGSKFVLEYILHHV